MREDFISFFVRGCWLVSFFFTPIYMFFLVFLVIFNIKKGANIVYSSNWFFKYFYNNYLSLHLKANRGGQFTPLFMKIFTHKYQFTVLTSRLTSYVLICFWVFFFFYGETLLLILFNYSTLFDAIPSSNFLCIKQHVIFFISTSSTKLLNYINFYIFFFHFKRVYVYG
jgi:hypothetical protein